MEEEVKEGEEKVRMETEVEICLKRGGSPRKEQREI